MLILQNLSYTHPNGDTLFRDINLSLGNREKAALIGNNGAGKSTLLRIIAGQLLPTGGHISADSPTYYLPQVFGQYNDLSIAQALGIQDKLTALHSILAGNVSEHNMTLLNDDWTIEERCAAAFSYWGLAGLELSQSMGQLSGGQKTRALLAGIDIHEATLVFLDEPSNHLDIEGRERLYQYIIETSASLLVVSHDRTLLNLLDTTYELDRSTINTYGGNYEFYAVQKEAEERALEDDVQSTQKALRKAKEKERETMERQQKLDARGKKKQDKAGVARIMMNTLRNNAEQSTAKAKTMHEEKIGGLAQELQQLRQRLPAIDQMRIGFDDSLLHKGKLLFSGSNINYTFDKVPVWKEGLHIEIRSGERIALKGSNGSGKTTLIGIMLGTLQPQGSRVYRALRHAVYIDQDYSLLNNTLSVYEQLRQYNTAALEEHELKIMLTRFLFGPESWDKPCAALSGGERMRLLLCCLTIGRTAPDMIILDEPTNNLDIQNIEILTTAISAYKGTLIVVSHDAYFIEQLNVNREIIL